MSTEQPIDEDSGLPMNDGMVEFVEALTFWHTTKITRLRDIQGNVKAGTTLKIGSDDKDGTVLSKRESALFQAGMEAVLIELEKLPFTVTRNDTEDEEGD